MSLKSFLLTALVSFTIVPLATTAIARPAAAHNVETDYILSDPSQLDIQVMFSNGEPFEDAPVQIYSPDDFETPILEGTTDAEGRFSFNPDTIHSTTPTDNTMDIGEWKMKIGELGHGDILLVPVDEEGIDIDLVSDGRPVHQPANQSAHHLANNRQGLYWATGFAILAVGLMIRTAQQTDHQDTADSHQ